MLRSAIALAVCSALAGSAFADDAATGSGIRVDRNGRLVSVDPQLRANLLAQLRAALQANGTASASSAVRILADGTEAITLGADHTTFVVSRIARDAALETSCVHGADAAAAFLAAAAENDAAAKGPDAQ